MDFSFFRRNPDPNDPREWTEDDWQKGAEAHRESEDRVRTAMAAQERGWAFVDLSRVEIAVTTTALLPWKIIVEHCVLPVKRDGGTLWVATPSFEAGPVDLVKEITGLRAIPVLCTQGDLDRQIRRLSQPG